MPPLRVLFVFRWLVVGGEETEVRLLVRHLDPTRYQIEVVACLRKANMPEQTHQQLEALGVTVDRTPYGLSDDRLVRYLRERMAAADVVVTCQGSPEAAAALEGLAERPPLIEHGGLVDEVHMTPKHFTTRYVGVCASIQQAAAACMPDRPDAALEIPSMVDLSEFDPRQRAAVRTELNVPERTPLVGWVGRLDRKKRVEDFVRAAALLRTRLPLTQFLVVGGPDAFMPEYADELRGLRDELGLGSALRFLGDRADVPRLLTGLDALAWLSRNEGMPHIIAEAGAAGVAVVATRDNGSAQQITEGVSGLFVPHEDPPAVADALERVLRDDTLRERLGRNLQRHVRRSYSAEVVVPRWEQLFDEVAAERHKFCR